MAITFNTRVGVGASNTAILLFALFATIQQFASEIVKTVLNFYFARSRRIGLGGRVVVPRGSRRSLGWRWQLLPWTPPACFQWWVGLSVGT